MHKEFSTGTYYICMSVMEIIITVSTVNIQFIIIHLNLCKTIDKAKCINIFTQYYIIMILNIVYRMIHLKVNYYFFHYNCRVDNTFFDNVFNS